MSVKKSSKDKLKEKSKYRYDCLDFRGYKPCEAKKTCTGCSVYRPWSRKILVVKLGALGDVLRTTPILHAFHREDPRTQVTWVTRRGAKDLLETSPRIHRLIFVDDTDNGAMLRLMVEEFDEVHCYDKDDAAIALASLVKAKKKFGFFMNAQGQMAPLNKASEYSFDLGLSDDLKFKKNEKSYQEMLYECSERKVPSPMDPYDFQLRKSDREPALFLEKQLQGAGPIIGLNTGSGKVFQTKQWLEEYFETLARQMHKEFNARVLLLGGVDEFEKNTRLAERLKGIAHFPGAGFTIRQFAGVLNLCDIVVTGDTLAMHLCLALGTAPVVLFGSTCHQEVELYEIGKKIVSSPACAPCYKNVCDQTDKMACMKSIEPNDVMKSIQQMIKEKNGTAKRKRA